MTKLDAPAPVAAATPARRGRPSKKQAEGTADTRESILDAAEDLFSKHGFYGVTIREVAREAGVDTALVHYYFGAKRALFDAVFLRRAEVWNAERVDAVNRYAREVDLYWAYHNLSGALTLTLGETGRLDRLSGGLCRSGDLESACDYMVRYAAAGFRAVCTPGSRTG